MTSDTAEFDWVKTEEVRMLQMRVKNLLQIISVTLNALVNSRAKVAVTRLVVRSGDRHVGIVKQHQYSIWLIKPHSVHLYNNEKVV